jgi:hypothetical protein
MMHLHRYYPVRLTGKTDRIQKILAVYKNTMLLKEYDEFGRPLCICPNGQQGIFCISPDGFWNGWFQLTEIDFTDEEELHKHMERQKNEQ